MIRLSLPPEMKEEVQQVGNHIFGVAYRGGYSSLKSKI